MSHRSDEESGIFIVQDVKVTSIGITDFSKEEAENYVSYVKKGHPNDRIVSINVILCDDGLVDVKWTAHNDPFERIRRITGEPTK